MTAPCFRDTTIWMKKRYLQAMGVERWRLRAPDAVRAYYCYTFFNSNQQPVGLLMADVTVQDKVELDLAEAIVKATRLKVVEGLQPAETANVLILLGPKVIDFFFQNGATVDELRGKVHKLENYSTVVSYSPAQLLANKSLKAETWRDLKVAMKLMTPS